MEESYELVMMFSEKIFKEYKSDATTDDVRTAKWYEVNNNDT